MWSAINHRKSSFCFDRRRISVFLLFFRRRVETIWLLLRRVFNRLISWFSELKAGLGPSGNIVDASTRHLLANKGTTLVLFVRWIKVLTNLEYFLLSLSHLVHQTYKLSAHFLILLCEISQFSCLTLIKELFVLYGICRGFLCFSSESLKSSDEQLRDGLLFLT